MLKEFFERVAVISLERQPERWAAFEAELPTNWPLARPRRFAAIDGAEATLPGNWPKLPAMYGRMLSHRAVLRQAIADGVQTLLVLEDDARFDEGFAEAFARFADELPGDWEFLYVGGRTDGQATQVSAHVASVRFAHGFYCYAVRGRMIGELLEQLTRSVGPCDLVVWPWLAAKRVYAPWPRVLALPRKQCRRSVGSSSSSAMVAVKAEAHDPWADGVGERLWGRMHRAALAGTLTDAVLDDIESEVPCGSCREHFRELRSRKPFDPARPFEWTVDAHDDVNERKGRARFGLEAARARWASEERPSLPAGWRPRQWMLNRPRSARWQIDPLCREWRRQHPLPGDAHYAAYRRYLAQSPWRFSGDLAAAFDAVYVVNLDRRADRLEAFNALLAHWPFKKPIRFAAFDGRKMSAPADWTHGRGAWGCLQSHRSLLAGAIAAGHRSVLVLEDDAIWQPTLAAEALSFLFLVPGDWDALWLGHQSLGTTTPVGPGVLRSFAPHRTHAFALRGPAMAAVHDAWAVAKTHADHAIKDLLGRELVTYTPSPPMFGQAAGDSDIGSETNERWWAVRPAFSSRTVENSGPATPGNTAVISIAQYPAERTGGMGERCKYLLRSCAKAGVELHLFGVDEAWTSHWVKVDPLRNWIRSLPGKFEYVLYLDARDTLFVRPLAAACAAFNRSGAKILAGAEHGCWPLRTAAWEANFPQRGPAGEGLCAGAFMGQREALLESLGWMSELSERMAAPEPGEIPGDLTPVWDTRRLRRDDQHLWQCNLLLRPGAVALDGDAALFANIATHDATVGRGNRFYDVAGGGLRFRPTGEMPAVLHFSSAAGNMGEWARWLGVI